MGQTTFMQKLFNPSFIPVWVQAIGFILLIWLQTHFVTISTFTDHVKTETGAVVRHEVNHEEISKSIVMVAKTLAVMETTKPIIDGIDARQREVLIKLADHEARLKVLEDHKQ